MKTLSFKNMWLLVRALVITGLLLVACKKPTDGLELIIDTDVLDSSVSFEFLDAMTGEPVKMVKPYGTVKVEVNGPSAASVVDNSGSKSWKVSSSYLTLGVKKGTEPGVTNPIKFNVIVHMDGYLSTSVAVNIIEKGDQHIKVYLVDVNNTPKGVAGIQDITLTTNSNGETTQTLVLSTPDLFGSTENTGATVTIPQGTKLMDANMQPVTGNITTTLVYFNNQDEEALRSFPGGFAVTTEEFGDIVFKTAGFIAMEMVNGSGKEVKNFSTPIHMNVEIPAATTNTEDEAIKDGMTVPIWSYTTNDAQWQKESDAVIKYNAAKGQYETEYDMIHLSYWNLDWFQTGACSMGAKLKISSDRDALGYFKLKYPNGTYYYHMDNLQVKNGGEIQIRNGFSGQAMQVEVYAGSSYCGGGASNVLLGSAQITDLCSGSYPLNINFSLAGNIQQPEVTLLIDATCANKPGQQIRPTASVYAYSTTTWCWVYIGQMVNGVLKTRDLKIGEAYYFYGDVAGYWYNSDAAYTITEQNMSYKQELPVSICNKY